MAVESTIRSIGVIGTPGCGKTTFLKYLNKNIDTSISKLYLEQEIEESEKTPLDIVLSANSRLEKIKSKRNKGDGRNRPQ